MAESLRLVIDVDDRGSAVVSKFAGNVTKASDTLEQRGTESVDKVRSSVGRLTGSFGTSLKSLVAFGAGFAGVGTGIEILRRGVSTVVDFQAEMANVATLVDTSAVSVDGLRNQILQLPPALGSSAELARGLYQTLSAGVEPANAVKFVGEAAILAKAGLTGTATAVDVLTTTLNAYGLQAEETAHISSALFKTVELGKTTMGELAGALGTAIPIAASLGVNISDLSAAVATLTAGGLSTDEAITGLRSAFSAMIQQADRFRKAGIDVKAVLAEEGLVGVMRRLRDVTQGNEEELRKYIPDIRGLTAVLGLAGTQFADFESKQRAVEQAYRDGTAQQEAFAKQQATTKAALDRFINSLDRLANTVGPPVLALLGSLLDGATKLLTPITTLIGKITSWGKALTDKAVPGLQNTVTELGKLDDATRKANTSAASFSKTIGESFLDGVLKSQPLFKAFVDTVRSFTSSQQAAAEATNDTKDAIGTQDQAIKNGDASLRAYNALLAAGTDLQKEEADAVKQLETAFKTFGLESQRAVHASIQAMERDYQTLKDSGQATAQDLRTAAMQIAKAYVDAGETVTASWKKELKRLEDAVGQTAASIEARNKRMQDTITGFFRDGVLRQIAAIKTLQQAGELSTQQTADAYRKLYQDAAAAGGETFRYLEALVREWRDKSRAATQDVAKAHQNAAQLSLDSWRVANNEIAKLNDLVLRTTFARTEEGIRKQIEATRNQLAFGTFVGLVGEAQRASLTKELDALKKRLADIARDTIQSATQIGQAYSSAATQVDAAVKSIVNTSHSLRSGSPSSTEDVVTTSREGFQGGGAFLVGGIGGPDSQRVSFDATPGELVTVEPPGGSAAPSTVTINVHANFQGASEQDARILVQRITEEMRRATRRDAFRT